MNNRTNLAQSKIMEGSQHCQPLYHPKDLLITSFTNKYRGGRSTEPMMGIQITHMPTAIMVECIRYKSQYKNKATALEKLERKLTNLENDG